MTQLPMTLHRTGRPVVLIAEELSPATVEALGPDFEIRTATAPTAPSCWPRSPTPTRSWSARPPQVDAEALAAAKRLKVVARAGVGLDNVDVKAATQTGVMVVNAPTSNIVSRRRARRRADARRRPPHQPGARRADAAASGSASKYTGIELYEKTVGIVGLGRIGVLVAQRLARVRHERHRLRPLRAGRPRRPDGRAPGRPRHAARRVRLHVSVHLPKTPETVGPDRRRRSCTGPSRRLVLVNAARGGIVDEAALYDALKTGRIAAAGLDVFAKEPCTDSPLFELENVVATPHLGASTDEAQEKAGIAVARSVRLALSGELVPDAVNVQGGVIAEDVRPGIPLTEKLGRIFTGAGRRGRPADRRRGPRRDHRATTSRCSSWPRSRASSPTSSRTRSPT